MEGSVSRDVPEERQRALVGSSEETHGWGARKSGRINSKRSDLFLDVRLRL